ncbi:protein TolQ [Simiduia curdlanivorans]|uniref:Tol-Pal system protein TolQ n=1 Tax=Simiduia curdlanivorans TaxID=1492769 RepID=A0ABV8UYF4_9GAMM|nr:protein TolQ [Simiduia curdlanivorans]MDN3640328.1 protein TolQ [Simiduia curdlanivorans]
MNTPEQLSIWSLIADASLLVQMVMALLFLASIVSWVMIVQRGIYQNSAAQAMKEFERHFWSGGDLNQLYRQGSGKDTQTEGVENIFRAGFKEFSRLRQQSSADPDAVMEGVQRAMRVALAREEEKLEAHLPFLASVASVSPYVGLFGTVWGIMNSFRGLANVHQATLATVAPGISEALVATAMGLFAAIPAVLAYNKFSAKAESLSAAYETFSDEFIAILHRQVHAKS